MAGRTVQAAYDNYVEPLREALSCVTGRRLTLTSRSKLTADTRYTAVLGNMDPVPLKGSVALRFSAGQGFRIVKTEQEDDPRGPYKVQTIEYFYVFATATGQEILAFHWTPEAQGRNVVTAPHLHMGLAITTKQKAIRPGDLHKAHIPTGRVSLEAVVRFAITDFGVKPLRDDWRDVLDHTEGAFIQWRTR